MARYIDADKVMEKISHITVTVMGGRSCEKTIFGKALNSYREEVLKRIEDAPTADVVPKSEVKRVYYNLQAVLEERAETKQEIAREIFEELARKSTYVFPTMLYTIAKRDVDELKKKYIGGNDNG